MLANHPTSPSTYLSPAGRAYLAQITIAREEGIAAIQSSLGIPDRRLAAPLYDTEYAPFSTQRAMLTGLEIPFGTIEAMLSGLAALNTWVIDSENVADDDLARSLNAILDEEIRVVPPTSDCDEFVAIAARYHTLSAPSDRIVPRCGGPSFPSRFGVNS